MDKVAYKSEGNDFSETAANVDEAKTNLRCESPVFKCSNIHKSVRGSRLDSSDYDIPCYQVNQSLKSRTSSNYGNEAEDKSLPFSPVFSPILPPATQCQPPSIHSLGTIVKRINSGKNVVNIVSEENKLPGKKCNVFESLGMTDRDISWVSSMASPFPPAPESGFNTIEKATFFPEDKFQNIQPRALFSPTYDDDFGCKPLTFSSESDNEEDYKTNIRLSDVCATLKQLEVKSFEQSISETDKCVPESSCVSPVIKTKKKKSESTKKRKNGILVQSPKFSDSYEFSKSSQDFQDKTKSSVFTIQNFIDDDSFQSISFSGIDELCKTLVNATDSSAGSKTFDCDITLINNSCEKSNLSTVQKCFYSSKTKMNVYLASDVNNLHLYAQALEEADVNLNSERKIEKNLTSKGIVRLDMLDQNSAVDGTKRLYSKAFEENNESSEKKFKDDDGCNWDEMKQYLSESQLNISDSEIFKTVEILEKTLASQEEKELTKRKCTEDLLDVFKVGNELINDEVVTKTSEVVPNENKNTCTKDLDNFTSDTNELKGESSVAFETASGLNILISDNAISKAKELFKTCEENSENFRCSTGLGKKIKISKEALEKAKTLMLNCEENSKETLCRNMEKKIDISSEALEKAKVLMFTERDEKNIKTIKVSPEVLEKAKSLMSECEDGKLTTKTIKVSPESLEKAKTLMSDFSTKKPDSNPNVGFCTVSGKTIQVSNKALEKAKSLMMECDEVTKDSCPTPKVSSREFSHLGKTIKVSSEALEKAKSLLWKCDENEPSFTGTFQDGDSTTSSATKNNFEKKISNNFKIKSDNIILNKDSEKEKVSINASEELFSKKKIPEVVNDSEALTKLQIFNRIPKENYSPTKNVLKSSIQSFNFGFSKSSGNKIEISQESLAKAKALMSKIDEESGVERIEETKPLNPLPAGFLTGLGNTIKVSKENLEKAKAIMLQIDEEIRDVPSEEEKPNFPVMRFSTGLGIQVGVPKESLQETKDLMSKLDEVSRDTAVEEIKLNFPTLGFSTGSGNRIEVSKESMEKAKAFMSKVDEETSDLVIEETKLSNCLPKQFSSSPKKEIEASLVEEPLDSESGNVKLSNSLPMGFSTGSGNKIKVPEDFLEKAKVLMLKADEEIHGVEVKEKNQGVTTFEIPPSSKSRREILKRFQDKDKTFISKSKELKELNSKATEESKLSNLRPVGFSTASGSEVTVSEEALIKARESMTRWEIENTENVDQKSKSTKISKAEHVTPNVEESNAKDIDISDWDEIIPSWLHVYNTSPSIASDRIELSPIASDTNGIVIKPKKEYICKSPVLGSQDRFYRKIKRKKLQFDEEKSETQPTIPLKGFVVPYNTEKTSGTKENAKRTSSMDFSVPFKRAKLEKEISETTASFVDVLEKRAKARAEQEKIAAEKQKVRPLKGSHLLKKSREKQIKFIEGVKNSLPEIFTDEDLESFGVKKDVLSIKISNASNFKFNGFDFFGSSCIANIDGFPVGDGCVLIPNDDNNFGVDEFKRSFLASPGVQPNLIPFGWLENHYKWIVWKLAHYERSFPRYFAGKCLTPHNTMIQLKYRYDREIDRSERSALKKILERDDTAAKRMVLCVCGIKKIANTENKNYELDLTDGWYSCSARVDSAMTRLIEEEKITIGTKLVTQGATLFNCEQGISPLEIGKDVYLKISTNSTRRVRWDTKLGFQKNPENFTTSLRSILPQGGSISRVNVIMVRIYPVLYMEKTPDGHHVTRNLRLEERAQAEYRKIQERKMEMICNEIQAEMRKSELNVKNKLNNFNSHDEQSDDFIKRQGKIFQDQNDRLKREFNQKMEEKLRKEKLNERNVTEFFRVKMVDLKKPDYNNPAVLSVWNPNEDILNLLSEGKAFSISNISIGNSRSLKPIQVNTTRATQFKQIIKSINYSARRLTRLRDVSTNISPVFEEIDVVGIVSKIQNIAYGSRLSQVVYLTDGEFNFIGILFWGSSKDYGWENVLQLRSVVACSNLQWKKNYCLQEVPTLHVNENSVFTENPKHVHLKEEIERLKLKLPQDLNAFFSKCDEDLTLKLEETKWRNNTSRNDSMTKNSNLERVHRENRFESKPSASSTPLKPFRGGLSSEEPEPSPIQRKIEKLESYGEPPPLPPLIISHNQRKLRRKTQTERESLNQ